MINCLVRIKDGPFINRLGIIAGINIYNEYNITFNFKILKCFREEIVEFLSLEPQFNHFCRTRCYWCDTNLKYYKKNLHLHPWNIRYCPKCLR